MKNPPILILDEATSALDNESEILVGQSLEKLAHGRTTLTIAHRLTTIKDYDRILVLGEEGIVEEGTHAQLVEPAARRGWGVKAPEIQKRHPKGCLFVSCQGK